MGGSSRSGPLQAAPIDVDLAYDADPDLAPELLAAAGPWGGAPEPAAEAWSERLALWLAALQVELADDLRHASYSLGLALVSDGAIAELNSDWRGKDSPTDVLAFAARESAEDAPPPPAFAEDLPLELGDIVISLETAARQAPDHQHTLADELQFLASHGLLHLLGWDHPDAASLEAMLALQQRLMRL